MNAFSIVAIVAGVILALGVAWMTRMKDDTNDGDVGEALLSILVTGIGGVALLLDGLAYLVWG